MRRPDPLEWLLIAATMLAFAALGQVVLVSANARLVHTLTAALTESRAAAQATDAPGAGGGDVAGAGDMPTAHAAIDEMSTGIAADTAAILDRNATWLAVTNAALLLMLVAAIVVRARQISRQRSAGPGAPAPPPPA